ncbi:chemotaxis protein CheD [Chitinibacteraceae bacterium HSL-7]
MGDHAHDAADFRLWHQRAVHLTAGRVVVERERPIATLLGSCVAVVLVDRAHALVGMNHFLLPETHSKGVDALDVQLSGMAAMELLVNAMLKAGSSKKALQAKAFGGGHLLPFKGVPPGERNMRFAEEWLRAEHIPLVAADWGGHHARRIVCEPLSGEVICHRLPLAEDLKRRVTHEEAQLKRQVAAELAARRVDYL